MITLEENTPAYKKFVRHCYAQIGDRINLDAIIEANEIMDNELQQYCGKFVERNFHRFIRFEKDSGYTMFILKWA